MNSISDQAFWEIFSKQEIGEMTLDQAKDQLWDVFKQKAIGAMASESTETSLGELKSHINDVLRKLEQLLSSRSRPDQEHTLQSIPAELRKQIFGYLLINPELGEASAISQSKAYGGNVRRQDPADGNVAKTGTVWKSLLMNVPALQHVRRWKIVLNAMYFPYTQDFEPRSRYELRAFCRLLCEFQARTRILKELEVVIIPNGLERDGYPDPSELQRSLFPLELLRNVPKVTIRTANIAEMPDFICSDDWHVHPLVTQSILPSSVYRKHLIKLARGNTEVELSTKMFAALERYAMTFERDPVFKKDMGMSSDDFVHKTNRDMIKLKENPFWNGIFHPKGNAHTLEYTLGRARYWAEWDYRETITTKHFKRERSKVLKYLENQFCAVRAASDRLVDFVKLEKRDGGIFLPFDLHESFDLVSYTEALVLLEEYAESFTRELDPSTKSAIRVGGALFKARYELLPRELWLKGCDIAYQLRDTDKFFLHFRSAVEDMDRQYREMLEARALLFEWDLSDTIPDVEIRPLTALKDWEIQWEMPEPAITVLTKSEMSNVYPDFFEQNTGWAVAVADTYSSEQGEVQDEDDIPEDSTNLQHDDDLPNDSDSEHEAPDLTAWEALPFFEDDEFYIQTYQVDNNNSQSPLADNIHAGTNEGSEYDYYEETFRDHPDDESLYLNTEQEDHGCTKIVGSIHDHVNTGGSIFHVLPWLADLHN
ncbi:hypothetical protein SBOR_6450 [Sclerotinia borealis F-4128]|uniref:Uncharacterized protein n=1 Tax=Sclerotinia borealis (strain F-4128) TaxID=1432307 RepID=W9CBE4_SCLBF|nr:hypothetical protein SBOR_6450 [Sclerotinia borealis F-4128]